MREHGDCSGNSADDPESAGHVFEHVLEDEIMDENDDDGERTGEGKCPGSQAGTMCSRLSKKPMSTALSRWPMM